jgi:hypothetical protein
MGDLMRRLERLEAERDRVEPGRIRQRFPVLVFSMIASEPGVARMAEWISGYEGEKAQLDAGGKLPSSRYYRSTITSQTSDGHPVSMPGHEYYMLAKEGRRIDCLTAEALKRWLDQNGFPSW